MEAAEVPALRCWRRRRLHPTTPAHSNKSAMVGSTMARISVESELVGAAGGDSGGEGGEGGEGGGDGGDEGGGGDGGGDGGDGGDGGEGGGGGGGLWS